jgi:predicted nucleotidyltransferase
MINSKYKIYVDMDGVLTDWEKQFETYSGGIPVSTYEASHGKKRRYNFVRKNSPDFYATMPWMTDGKLLYDFVKDLPSEILSHATDPECETGKLTWLKNNGVNLKPNLVRNRVDKAKYASPNSILIDDKPENVQEFTNAGGIGILHKDAVDTINKLKQYLGVKQTHRIYNSVLNPELWDNDVLKPEVQQKMLKIANEFYKSTELNAPLEDVYFLGSTAGYNWTPNSDIDLHVLIDFAKIDPNKELVKKYADSLKNKWNQEHDLKIGSHPVEVYIQDINDTNRSQAVYSVLKNEWIKKPTYQDIQIDKESIKKKYYQYVQMIDDAIKKQDLDIMKNIITKLYDMREAGLSSSGEYSTENLVFKLLRSTGYISKLRSSVRSVYDMNLNKV